MMIRILPPLALAVTAVAAGAQQSSAGRAADRFRLDMPAAEPAATPSPDATATPDPTPNPAATLAAPAVPDSQIVTGAAEPAPTEGARAAYTLDTPIADLIANPATKAVLDRDLPGLSSDENLPKFDRLGLKQFQPLTGGQLTDALLAKVAKDLAATGGAVLAAPARTTTRDRRNDTR